MRDSGGRSLAGVSVTLEAQENSFSREAVTSGDGAFIFSDVPPGTYLVKVNVQNREPFASAPVTAGPGEKRDLPPIDLLIATKKTTVDVTASVEQIAEEQVKEEEKQRLFGVLPNYYTSYIWDAAPMTPKLKFKLAVRTAVDPITFLVVAGIAGAEQYNKSFPGYELGLDGYARRFSATYADTVSGRVFGSAIFPALFHQDPRYFYRGSGSTRSRILYALAATVICRGDDGRLEPNYSHVLGSFTAAGLSNLYRSPQDRTAGLTIRNGFIITGGSAVVNLMREFLSRKLTPNVPTFANGKP